jgi:acyl-CoA reductase-like NAD-dependent aldehyde dehydrogenase
MRQEEPEGLFLANASKYGLGAGLWTQDIGRAHRLAAEIEAGLVWINTHHRNDPSSPWGGMKESGIGRENGVEALESCRSSLPLPFALRLTSTHTLDSQSKSTIVNIASVEETRATHDWFAEEDVEGARYG